MSNRNTAPKVAILGLNWWIRNDNRSPVWRKKVDGHTYYSPGDKSGQPTEHSAELAAKDIAAQVAKLTRQEATDTAIEAAATTAAIQGTPVDLMAFLAPPPALPHNLERLIRPAFNLSAAIESYLKAQSNRQLAGEITVHGWTSIKSEVGYFRDWLSRNSHAVVNESVIADYRQHLAIEFNNGNQQLATVKRKLAAAKRLINWLYEMNLLGQLPRNLKSAMTFNLPKKERAKEKHAVDVFTVKEIQTIFNACCEETQLHILLALNCGMYYADIADLRHSEYKDERITRSRSKTGESGSWRVWQLTQKLLEKFAAPVGQYPTADGTDSFMLRHKDGGPLYEYGRNPVTDRLTRVNHIEARFFDALKAVGIKGDFRKLRKTGASLVRDASNTDTAKLFLANSKESIAERHYLADNFSGLDKALEAVEQTLKLS